MVQHKFYNACHVLESFQKQAPSPWSMEKCSSMKPVPKRMRTTGLQEIQEQERVTAAILGSRNQQRLPLPGLTWKGRDIFQLGILPADPTTCSQYPWRDQRTSTTMKSNSWCWDEPHCPKRALITSVTRKSISERQNTPFYLSSIWITPPTKKFGIK